MTEKNASEPHVLESHGENAVTRSQFAERHPFWFVAILEVVVILVYLVAGTLARFMKPANVEASANANLASPLVFANIALTVMVVFLLSSMVWWRVVGFRRPARVTDLRYYAVPFLPAIVSLVVGVEVSSGLLLLQFLALTLMIGFVEESIFRGLMLNALKPRGAWTAVIVTSMLFALSHSLNLLSGKNLADVAMQILYALAIGFAFAALVLKKGLLWPLVLTHFLIDFTAMIGKTDVSYEWNIVLGVAITFIIGSYGLFVMLQVPEGKTA